MFQHYHTFKTLLWDIATPGKQIGVALCLLALVACSGDRLGSGTPPESLPAQCQDDPDLPECTVPAAGIFLTLSTQEIKSDGSDSTTVTATVLDENNAVIEGVQVDFSATGGKLSKRFIFTDELGEAAVDFSASRANPTNEIVYVTAAVTGVGSASIPVRIVGTTLEILVDNTSLLIDVGATQVQESITVVAKDAGGQLIYDVPLTFGISGLAGASLSSAVETTDTSGEVAVTLTASQSGSATFSVTGLGTSTSQVFTIANVATDNPFRILSPTTDPYPVTADDASTPLTITVNPSAAANVRFATTVGSFSDCVTFPRVTVITVPAASSQANLYSCTGDNGFATVITSDAADSTVFDSLIVAMSPPESQASKIFLRSDVKTLPPSNDVTKYSANVTAVVVTDDASGNYPIYNVPVAFTIANSTGGGEVLSKSFGTTDINGQITTKFTSGITATGAQGILITATLVNNSALFDSFSIEVGGTAGSVAIGEPVVIQTSSENDAINIYNMSVIVADGNGAGVSGSQVSLQIWPASYYTGVWYDADPGDNEEWKRYISGGPFANEDVDEDLILDIEPAAIPPVDEDTNKDLELTPKNSDAGSVPISVTTLEDGTGAFDYTYLKSVAGWLEVRIKGSTKVLGTEVTSTHYFIPDSIEGEVDQGYVLNSPYKLPLHAAVAGGWAYSINVALGAGTPYIVSPIGCDDCITSNGATVTWYTTLGTTDYYGLDMPPAAAGTVLEFTVTVSGPVGAFGEVGTRLTFPVRLIYK